MLYYCGIDVGKHGGAVIINYVGALVNYYPNEEKLKAFDFPNDNIKFFLEQCQAGGGSKLSNSSIFSFGEEYGRVLGYLEAKNKTYTLVHPRSWQKIFYADLPVKFNGKERSIEVIRQYFPKDLDSFCLGKSKTPHDGLCDARIIAEWGRLYSRGEVNA